MAPPAMTPKERWLAAYQMQPVDRLPFWPKLDAAYPRAQRQPFSGMSLDAIHDWIGSDKHIWSPTCAREGHATCAREASNDGRTRRALYRTPYGEMESIDRFDVPSQAWHPVKFPVESLDHVHWMTAWYEDVRVELDPEALQRVRAQVARYGQDAVICTSVGESPLMHWVEWTAGIERAHYLLMDHKAEVEALFTAMHRVLLDKARLIAEHSPVDVLYMTENTSTTLISPQQYRRYCYGHITEYGQIARRHGRLMALHMCGHLKLLLPDLAQLPVDAFEAFTAPTLGNTTLLDGRVSCPDKCLIGGTNAMLWTRSAPEIVGQIEHDLGELPHHRGVVVTSAGVMPPLCRPETIKSVCEWVKAYPARTW